MNATPNKLPYRNMLILLISCAALLFSACTRSAATLEVVGTPGPTATPTQAPVGVQEGTTAPEFTLHDYTGEEVRLSSLRGQAVIAYFWNTSCAPCRDDMTALQALYERYQANGLTVLGINNKEQSLVVDEYAESLGVTFPLLLDREGTITEMYRVRSFPSIFFIDRNGVITQTSSRAMKPEDMDATAQQIIASVAILPTEPPTPEPITALEGCVTADALNVRLGPGIDNEIARLLQNGACTTFDARNADSTWIRLADPAESPRQWVSAEYVELLGDINSLPPAE